MCLSLGRSWHHHARCIAVPVCACGPSLANSETHPEMLEYFHGANLDGLPDFFVRPTPVSSCRAVCSSQTN